MRSEKFQVLISMVLSLKQYGFDVTFETKKVFNHPIGKECFLSSLIIKNSQGKEMIKGESIFFDEEEKEKWEIKTLQREVNSIMASGIYSLDKIIKQRNGL